MLKGHNKRIEVLKPPVFKRAELKPKLPQPKPGFVLGTFTSEVTSALLLHAVEPQIVGYLQTFCHSPAYAETSPEANHLG